MIRGNAPAPGRPTPGNRTCLWLVVSHCRSMLSRRAVFVPVLALALLAGPAAAVCSACCPASDERLAIMSMPACCGNCEPSVESAKDRVPATIKKTTNDRVVAALANPTMITSLEPSFSRISPFAIPAYLHTPSPPTPLRL